MTAVTVAEVPGAGERVFDRIESTNPARDAYRLSTALETVGDKPLRSYSWRHVQLDQFAEGACTGFNATMEAAARPKPLWGDPVRRIFSPGEIDAMNRIARSVYKRAQQLDIWPGEDYEGSSVDGACLAGRELGWWDGWVWASGTPEQQAEQVIRAVAFRGPVMHGSLWKRGMRADEHGFMSYSGETLGGHAYLWTKYSIKRDALWTPNSWGGAGQGWVRRLDLVAMFGEGADAALVTKRLKPKPTS